MRAYVIKRKGPVYWGNMYLNTEVLFNDGSKVYADNLFYRKKDAEKYLSFMQYKELFEVIGLTFDNKKKEKGKEK